MKVSINKRKDKHKIYFIANTGWFHYMFNYNLIKRLSIYYNITIISQRDIYVDNILSEIDGVEFIPINIKHKSVNPFIDLYLFFQFLFIFFKTRPDIILNFTIKPLVYATLAGYINRVKVINQITGLGTTFIHNKLSNRIGKFLYIWSQRFASHIFFQNQQDYDCFDSTRTKYSSVDFIPGPGVDINKFHPNKLKNSYNPNFTFTFIGRIIKDKGIIEFINASKKLYQITEGVEFIIVGPIDNNNQTSLSKSQLTNLISGTTINYIGPSENIINILSISDCLVLPSYREGTGKVLLEAGAMGLPLIASDCPGCNSVVIDNYNGYLCEVGNSEDLYMKMHKMLNNSNDKLKLFGANARQHIIDKYDENIVIKKYRKYIDIIL